MKKKSGQKNWGFWEKLLAEPAEALALLGNPVAGAEAIEAARWPNGPICPNCGSPNAAPPSEFDLTNKRRYRCRACARQFNWKSGTWMAGSRITADRFIAAVVAMAQSGPEGCQALLVSEGKTDPATAARLTALVAESLGVRHKAPKARVKKALAAGAAVAGGVTLILSQMLPKADNEDHTPKEQIVERVRYDFGDPTAKTFLITPRGAGQSHLDWIATHSRRVEALGGSHDDDQH
ncbi:MAG: transposase [Planctomycetes bacterium]|nr:transposase [Planctomycetota bacterium]MCB9910526.1 transposase [Planctomycetota bacterium]MCB9912652.1 transposase [Planctomycetota bacterium]HPF15347.1 transposase [Planctomycetota bacterium]